MVAQYVLQQIPGAYPRVFDGTFQVVPLRLGDEFEVRAPWPTSWLRCRLGQGELHRDRVLQVSGTPVAGGRFDIPLAAGWRTYYVPLCGPMTGPIKLAISGVSAAPASEIAPDMQLGLVSLAVVDAEWKARELTSVGSRAHLLASREAPSPESNATRAARTTAATPRAENYLHDVRDAWEEFGRTDPLYYILTDPKKAGNRWLADEFFEKGRSEIDLALDAVDSLGAMAWRRRALDFGCGVGRLSQGLARHFDEVHGVDIARSMVAGANRLNLYPDRVHYHATDAGHLGIFPDASFDFIYTGIVLQHMRPAFAMQYLDEFMRLLAPGGVLLFQLPSHPHWTRQGMMLRILPEQARMKYLEKNWLLPPKMEFHWAPRRQVLRQLRTSGGQLRGVLPDHSAEGPTVSYRYCVTKPGMTSGNESLPRIAQPRLDAGHANPPAQERASHSHRSNVSH